MRLTCPRCGAQYEIDATAIPAGGRDVECSACDHVWRAMPGAEPFDPDARPALSRPLSESVIEILREEAARELEVRAAERRTQRAAERAGELAAGLAAPEIGRGATQAPSLGAHPGREAAEGDTGDGSGDLADDRDTGAAELADTGALPGTQSLGSARGSELDELAAASFRASDDQAAPARGSPVRGGGPADDAAAGRRIAPATGHPADARVAGRGAGSIEAGPAAAMDGRASPVGRPAPPADPALAASTASRPRRDPQARRGHVAGFGLAVMIALVAVALYALAPRVADRGPLGATLAGWRTEVDRGRDWLSQQGAALTGRLRGEPQDE